MSALIVDGRPSNLFPAFGVRVNQVESDVWMVCDRIKEKFGDKVYIVVMDDGSSYAFTAMERCVDGEDRIIKKYKELTPQILNDLDFMLRIDMKQRMKILEAENEKWEREWQELQAEKQFEEVGLPMHKELERAGFIQRNRSYPKAGVATHGRARR